MLDVDPSYMEKHLMDMAIDRKLVLKETRGYSGLSQQILSD